MTEIPQETPPPPPLGDDSPEPGARLRAPRQRPRRSTSLMSLGRSLEGRYKIDALLGQGGMARVYKGVDVLLERGVAIKVLNLSTRDLQDNEDEALLERFDREIRAAARIDHPNAVTIHDAGVLGATGQPYMIMELLNGQPLDEALAHHGPMSATRALARTREALGALTVAHQRGVVHKDLKPSNLFLRRAHTPAENLCVVDFGVAHIYQDPQGRLTQTGLLCGTPQYLPPEYASHGEIRPAGDVYQMALILIEMLTGRPIVDDTMPLACAVRHTNGDLTLPKGLMATKLGPILAQALHLNPDQRYPDAQAFQHALAQVDAAALPYPPTQRDPDATRDAKAPPTAICKTANTRDADDSDAATPQATDSDALPTLADTGDVECADFQTVDIDNSDALPPSTLPTDDEPQAVAVERLAALQRTQADDPADDPASPTQLATPWRPPHWPSWLGPLQIVGPIAAAASLLAILTLLVLIGLLWPGSQQPTPVKTFSESLTTQTRPQVQMAKQHLTHGAIKSIRLKPR